MNDVNLWKNLEYTTALLLESYSGSMSHLRDFRFSFNDQDDTDLLGKLSPVLQCYSTESCIAAWRIALGKKASNQSTRAQVLDAYRLLPTEYVNSATLLAIALLCHVHTTHNLGTTTPTFYLGVHRMTVWTYLRESVRASPNHSQLSRSEIAADS